MGGMCERCGEPLPDWPAWRAKHFTGRFCSRICMDAWRGDPEQFFWSKLEREPGAGCWNWARSIGPGGYGFAAYKRRTVLAHRLAYKLACGDIPAGLCVLHRCDNPRCCRPDHLFLGTQRDNMLDRAAKGHDMRGTRHWKHKYPERTARGERSNLAKLQEADVRAIRERYATGGITQAELATAYGVRQGTIAFIVAGKTWKHVH